jgi:hypothetical protein
MRQAPLYASNIEITEEKDAVALTADIIAVLNELALSKKDRQKVESAIHCLQKVQGGHHGQPDEIDSNIIAILKTADALV